MKHWHNDTLTIKGKRFNYLPRAKTTSIFANSPPSNTKGAYKKTSSPPTMKKIRTSTIAWALAMGFLEFKA